MCATYVTHSLTHSLCWTRAQVNSERERGLLFTRPHCPRADGLGTGGTMRAMVPSQLSPSRGMGMLASTTPRAPREGLLRSLAPLPLLPEKGKVCKAAFIVLLPVLPGDLLPVKLTRTRQGRKKREDDGDDFDYYTTATPIVCH